MCNDNSKQKYFVETMNVPGVFILTTFVAISLLAECSVGKRYFLKQFQNSVQQAVKQAADTLKDNVKRAEIQARCEKFKVTFHQEYIEDQWKQVCWGEEDCDRYNGETQLQKDLKNAELMGGYVLDTPVRLVNGGRFLERHDSETRDSALVTGSKWENYGSWGPWGSGGCAFGRMRCRKKGQEEITKYDYSKCLKCKSGQQVLKDGTCPYVPVCKSNEKLRKFSNTDFKCLAVPKCTADQQLRDFHTNFKCLDVPKCKAGEKLRDFRTYFSCIQVPVCKAGEKLRDLWTYFKCLYDACPKVGDKCKAEAYCRYEEKLDYRGDNGATRKVKNKEECCALCAKDLKCKASVFAKWDNNCWLKHGSVTPWRNGRDVVSCTFNTYSDRRRTKIGLESAYCNYEKDVDFKDSGSMTNANTQEECCVECFKDSKCKAAVFLRGECWKKYSTKQRISKKGVLACTTGRS